jgi:hypothetical protein
MDARSSLERLARALKDARLEAILIGNAAAALHGAPVTTLDFDFLFRKTPANVKKLRTFADGLGAVVLKPYYPASDLYRVIDEDHGLQADFMSRIHGVRSFESLRSRASLFEIGAAGLLVADLEDILRSKRAAGRPRDLAVLPVLEATLDEERKFDRSKAKKTARGTASRKRT